jgi:peptide/nickel transport system permease protein
MLPLGLFPTDVQKPKEIVLEPRPEVKERFQQILPFLGYLATRLFAALATFLIITIVVYAISLFVPADDRARLYLPERLRYEDSGAIRNYLDNAIELYGLDDPLPIQYGRWLGKLVQGDWGYSSLLRTDVFDVLAVRSPATLELTLYSILIYIPLGLVLGAFIAWRQGRIVDHLVRAFSFMFTAIPPFVLGFVMIAIIYVQMGFLDLSRIGYAEKTIIQGSEFWPVTGLITVDGILNFRFDIAWQAVRHLAMPVTTLVAFYLATLVLVTRASVTEELQKEYVLLAKGLGLKDLKILFTYALRNAMLPGLTHSALTAAQLITGVYVVEAIFNWHGVSEIITQSMGSGLPDVNLALGFSVYNVIVVLSIVFILDLVQGVVDPRVRLGEE